MKTLNIKIEQTGKLTIEQNIGGDDAFTIPVLITANIPEINDKLEEIDSFGHYSQGWELINDFKREPVKIKETLEKIFGEDKGYEIADQLESEIKTFSDTVVAKAFEILSNHFRRNKGYSVEIKIK